MSQSVGNSKTRWGSSSIHLGNLQGAETELHYQLHLASIEYELSNPITIETEEDILSRKHWSEKLKPFEHQIQNLFTFCRRSPVALFADDVGLGKTISAGLVLSELHTRKAVRRALILCPKMVIPQWKEELVEKFGIFSGTGVGKDLEPWLHHSVPVVITTYDSARDRMDDIRAASFDMLILDEAHRLRNLHGSPKPPQLAKTLHESLGRRDFKFVLMLTATPIQNGLWDLYSLIDCLSVAKGHANPLGTPSEFAARYVEDSKTKAVQLRERYKDEFRRTVEGYMVRTSRNRARLVFPKRRVLPVQCDPSAAEMRLQQLVGTAMAGLNALARVSMAEALMSSPRALISQIRRMHQERSLDQRTLQEFERGVNEAGNGCKLAKLLQILDGLKAKEPTRWRALVFTRRLETVELVCQTLRERGIPTGTIRGSADSSNQQSIRAFRAESPGVHVLVSTDAGAVGLNLQVCNVVINYDLPWNPMVLEQRIGRVQRLNSSFQYVEVLNLTVKGSIEDRIVSRLMSKLGAIVDTLGDVEALLEASARDDEEFEDELRQMVTRAFMGQDTELAMKKAQESIDRAKEQYELEKQMVEKTLGVADAMHRTGPTAPKLKPKKPRFGVEDFCRSAFTSDGGHLRELPSRQLGVEKRGQGSWIATFDDKDPDLFRSTVGKFGGSPLRLYAEGSRHFEGLLGEWRKRHSHRVLDRVAESRSSIENALKNWIRSLDIDIGLVDWRIQREYPRFDGAFSIRATASVSHDRFEKLCFTESRSAEDGALPSPGPEVQPVRVCELQSLVPNATELVTQAVEKDSDIQEFISFYEARRVEEIGRAGESRMKQEDVSRRYTTSLAAEIVGASGQVYLTAAVEGVFGDRSGKTTYNASLLLVPLSGKILTEPPRARCEATHRQVPVNWLGSCSVSKQQVLKHLLEISPLSSIAALSKYFGICEATGRRLLHHELGKSEVSGKMVGVDLHKKSEISGRRALECELIRCEITGALALPDELERSGVSGRMVRSDRMVASKVSGIRGHRTEFRQCEETGDLILAEEGACSDLSNRFVRKDLLRPSEKNDSRKGLATEMVRCVATSKTLLKDEAVQSAVSGTWMDKEVAVHSGVSQLPALPSEIVTCQISGQILLPSETGTSAVSGRIVDARLLIPSELSKSVALTEEMRVCDFTGRRILRTEGIESDVSGLYVGLDQVVTSAISNLRGHSSEFVRCEASQAWILPQESDVSAFSGKKVRKDLLKLSDKEPRRTGLDDEFRICEVTGRNLLKDETSQCSVTRKWVDKDLLVASHRSGRMALEGELVRCEESKALLLPSEVGACSITGRLVDLQRMVTSEISGRKSCEDQSGTCEITGVLALKDELSRSDLTGKLFRSEQGVVSAFSGRIGHKGEMVQCKLTNQRVLSTETALSSVSGRCARTDLMVRSEKNPERLGFPEEVSTCEVTGKRLLSDELGRSAVSKKLVDRDLLLQSAASNRLALAGEMLACESSGVLLLPSEVGMCAVSGKRVDQRLLVKSIISLRCALQEHTGVCGYTGMLALTDELEPSAVTGTLCRKDQLQASQYSGLKGHRGELVKCAVSGQQLLPSEVGHSVISQKPARKDLLVASENSPHRLGLPDEIRECAASGKRLLADEVLQSDISGRWVDRAIAVTSEISGRKGLPEESLICQASGIRIFSDESGVCQISGKSVDRRKLVQSVLSQRSALSEHTGKCEFTGILALSDELVPSASSGKLCRMDQLEASALSGLQAHCSELVTCALSGQRLLTKEVAVSAVSQKVVRSDLLVRSEKNPSRGGLPDELQLCASSNKRILLDEGVRSDLSGRFVDKEFAVKSEATGRFGLADESIRCEDTGILILVDESEVCSVTGKRVHRRLLEKSGLSGVQGLSRLLQICPETRRKGFPNEMVTCAVTGLHVEPSQTERCSVTGKTMLRRLMVHCAVTKRWLHREQARISAKSGRAGHPDTVRICTWTGQSLLMDEVLACGITGLDFDSDLIGLPGAPAYPLVALMDAGIPNEVLNGPPTDSVRRTLLNAGIKPKGLCFQVSNHGTVVAFFTDCSGLLGLLKKHAVGFIGGADFSQILGAPRFGLLRDGKWIPEVRK